MRKMANAQITVIGNLGGDAEIKTLPSGKVITNLNVAFTPSRKQGESWIDGETMWFRVIQFGEKAETITDTLVKGDTVIVSGTLKQSTFTDKEGNQRTGLEIMADEIGIVPRPVRKTKTEDTPPW
jgi:single-strand DNA-binding protein